MPESLARNIKDEKSLRFSLVVIHQFVVSENAYVSNLFVTPKATPTADYGQKYMNKMLGTFDSFG